MAFKPAPAKGKAAAPAPKGNPFAKTAAVAAGPKGAAVAAKKPMPFAKGGMAKKAGRGC